MRYLTRDLLGRVGLPERELLESPMIFIAGPRQVGKTTEVKRLNKSYYNWDTPEVKKAFLKDPYFFRGPKDWIIFDEIHKRRRDWKKILRRKS